MSNTDNDNKTLCGRCKINIGELVTRNELLCKECFLHYVNGKLRKQMEEFKVLYKKNNTENTLNNNIDAVKILVPFSFGKSSLAMLNLLQNLRLAQKDMHKGKTGFDLTVVHIDYSGIKSLNSNKNLINNDTKTLLIDKLKCFYTDVKFLNIPIEKVFFNIEVDSVVDSNDTFWLNNKNVNEGTNDKNCEKYSIIDVLNAMQDKTSKEDILNIVLKAHIIPNLAKENNCKVILWGNSMTKMAELAISLTTKGRGSVLPFEIGLKKNSINNNLRNIYPVSDLLRSELENYINISNIQLNNEQISLNQLVFNEYEKSPNIKKLMSIDELVRNYFDDTTKDFPSIVSTVVRTIAKLKPQPISNEDTDEVFVCDLCGGIAYKSDSQWLSNFTVSNLDSTLDICENHSNDKESNTSFNPQICYGCTVTINNSKSFPWNKFNKSYKDALLDEYLIND